MFKNEYRLGENFKMNKCRLLSIVAGASLVAFPVIAKSQIYYYDLFNVQDSVQNGATTSSLAGYYATEEVTAQNSLDLSALSVMRPNGTVDNNFSVSYDPGNNDYNWTNSSSYYSTLSDFQADYPYGEYSFSASTPSGSISTNLDNASDLPWASSTLVTNYNALLGYNVTQNLNVMWTGFSPDANATSADTFVYLLDATTGYSVVASASGDSTMNSFSIGR